MIPDDRPIPPNRKKLKIIFGWYIYRLCVADL